MKIKDYAVYLDTAGHFLRQVIILLIISIGYIFYPIAAFYALMLYAVILVLKENVLIFKIRKDDSDEI